MAKLNLLDRETNRLICQLEDEILNLIDHQDDFTRSDLQGAATVIVIKILEMGLKMAEQN